MFQIAYCSNVHAGSNLAETYKNLRQHAVAVKGAFRPASDESMGIGLWLSAASATDVCAGDGSEIHRFKEFLLQSGFDPFTFNGFPFGDFHQEVVKRDVYLPTWFESDRLSYTQSLIRLILEFSDSPELSISTLPIAWGNPGCSPSQLENAAKNLADIAMYCSRIEAETGRLVHLCIEPEPGCQIQYGQDLVNFFEQHLLSAGDEALLRRHIRACHDVCHAVVMCESQEDVLSLYRNAGVEVGKVQVSSAIVADFDALEPADRVEAIQQLSQFAEDRYLHQTTVQVHDDTTFFEDLPMALQAVTEPKQTRGMWRIHFHIPIYLQEFGLLKASQPDIVECISKCRQYSNVKHFEVETYAWNVLPKDLQEDVLADGITKELNWFQELATQHLGTA
jgi:hypothetical protein